MKKKLIISVLITLLSMSLFVGCSNKNNQPIDTKDKFKSVMITLGDRELTMSLKSYKYYGSQIRLENYEGDVYLVDKSNVIFMTDSLIPKK